ncbi:MAG: sterol desaturase family protein, partial [Chitinophagia bacterium]|nr:sterol desaturase family protein [Chitinophagia bacterium]
RTGFLAKIPPLFPNWLEKIIVTPSHHRVHHASNIPYLDKNMGMVFIVWDRLFGTFVAEQPYEPPVYGLVKNLPNPHHPVKIVTHEWVDLRKDLAKKIPFYLKLKYLFMPPGWSHDGSTLTAKQLQTQYNQQNNNRYKS